MAPISGLDGDDKFNDDDGGGGEYVNSRVILSTPPQVVENKSIKKGGSMG